MSDDVFPTEQKIGEPRGLPPLPRRQEAWLFFGAVAYVILVFRISPDVSSVPETGRLLAWIVVVVFSVVYFLVESAKFLVKGVKCLIDWTFGSEAPSSRDVAVQVDALPVDDQAG